MAAQAPSLVADLPKVFVVRAIINRRSIEAYRMSLKRVLCSCLAWLFLLWVAASRRGARAGKIRACQNLLKYPTVVIHLLRGATSFSQARSKPPEERPSQYIKVHVSKHSHGSLHSTTTPRLRCPTV